MIDLNELSVEELDDIFERDGEEWMKKYQKKIFEPFIGQTFSAEAFKFYEIFDKRNDFSIRKGQLTKNKHIREVTMRDFFCHREGFLNKKTCQFR